MFVHQASDTSLRMASALSASAETTRAAELVCDQCEGQLGEHPDLVFVFFSQHHVEFASEISETVRRRLSPGCLIGVSTVAAIADTTELESSPGISLLAARAPGVRISPFSSDMLPAWDGDELSRTRFSEIFGGGPDHRAAFFFADPFSTPLIKLLPAMNEARGEGAASPILGGLASASQSPGGNAMLLNDRVLRSGAVGVSLLGNVRVDTIVSQGCRAFGPNLVITKSQRNLIFELGGKPALEAVSEAIEALPGEQREGLRSGLFIGRVIDEYKSRFGRGDFLIRNVVGVDHNRGAIAVAEPVHVGQTIRLHMRDAATAHEDLALLLDAQRLYDPPAGVLLVTCNGRGRRLFGVPNHDAAAVARAFAGPVPGETLAKPGKAIEPPGAPPVPLAGCFANGEIGPVGGRSFVHGHTACMALFRPGDR
ncbi:MAG: hypothetical protein DYG92_01315 [Leptolyngbya sp. PLA1]|nr:hypothetical protein [Leptolyngbya sp. PLA1]